MHISAVERSGLGGLGEGQRVSYELEKNRRTGKDAALGLDEAEPLGGVEPFHRTDRHRSFSVACEAHRQLPTGPLVPAEPKLDAVRARRGPA